VLVGGRSRRQSRQRGVASTYAVFDTPTICAGSYDIAVLDRDIPGPSRDEIAKRIVASGSGMPILMLTAADRLDDKTTGFGLGADDYLTKPFELQELALRLRALDRRRERNGQGLRISASCSVMVTAC